MGFVEIVRDALGITRLEYRLQRAEARSALMTKAAEQAGEALQAERDARERAEANAREASRLVQEALSATAPTPPAEPAWQACGCGCTSTRVELLLAKLGVVDGRLVRTEAGAVVTCARCGRRWAIDSDGVFVLHRAAWPSPWVVEAQLEAQAEAREQQREEARRTLRGKRNGVAGDMRFPPS